MDPPSPPFFRRLGYDGYQPYAWTTRAMTTVFRTLAMILIPLLIVEGLVRAAFALDWVASVELLPRQLPTQGPPVDDEQILHPYLGYVGDRQQHPSLSSHGWSGVEPLAPKSKHTFRVLLTGGSVSQQICDHHRRLIQNWKDVEPFKGKGIEFICASRGGYKQPQQLQSLSFLLAQDAKFDAVINLDGFNEIVLPGVENWNAGVDLSFPRSWHLFRKRGLKPGVDREVARSEKLQDRRDSLRKWAASPWGYSTTVRAILTLLELQNHHALLASWEKIQQQVQKKEYRRGSSRQNNGMGSVQKRSAQIWRSSSIQMSHLSRANGIPYFHFLQPNQYFSGSKRTFSKNERKIALQGNPGYGDPARAGYPLLVQEGAKIKRQGVWFTDLTQVFLNEPKPTYSDNCCHLNQRGKDMLADAIARAVLARLSETPESLAQLQTPRMRKNRQ